LKDTLEQELITQGKFHHPSSSTTGQAEEGLDFLGEA